MVHIVTDEFCFVCCVAGLILIQSSTTGTYC